MRRCCDTILSLEGAEKSKLCPALFLFRDPTKKKLLGMIGIHVDDDLILGSKHFFENQVAQLRKMHCYGKWHTSVEGFFQCGRFIQRQADGSLKCGQNEYSESLMPIPISKERRLNKDARATPSEREALQSGNGKLAWLVRSSRMDLAFRLVESQTRAQDNAVCFRVTHNLVVSKQILHRKVREFTFWPMDILKGVLLAFGDSSFANVGKNRTSSQAGLIIMYAADREALLRGERVRVSPLIWKSHRIERVVRSTLAAETMAALEAVEHADVMRGHFAELFEGIDCHSYYEDIQQISVIHLTDCRSLYDLLHRRGTVPSERRLLIDIEALRNDIETNGVVSRWINTKQMMADCLTKDDARAADYLRYVLRHGTYQIVEDPWPIRSFTTNG